MARVFKIREIKVELDHMCLIVNPKQQKGWYKIRFNPGCSKQFKIIAWVAKHMKQQRDREEDAKGIRGDEFLNAPYKISGKEPENIYKNWQYNYKDKYDRRNLKPTSLFTILDKKGKTVDDIEHCRKIVELLFHTTLKHKKPEETYYWLGEKDTEIEVLTKESEVPDQLEDWLIENVLDKKGRRFNKPMMFRRIGPMWVDFEQDFVVRRQKTVNQIIKELETKDVFVFKGKSATGKSVVLRDIGFTLSNSEKDVYLIEIKPKKKLPDVDQVLKKAYQGYLLIDNAHLDLSYVDDVIQNLSNVKILISTRDVEETSLEITEHIKDAIEITGYDTVSEIIEKFGKKSKKKCKIPQEIRGELTKNNLWILAWQLMAYEEFGRVDENAVCKKVMHYMRKNLKEFGVNSAENVFLPLSAFYKYEIPVRKEFVGKFAEYEDIKRLVELNEIDELEKEGFEYLAMHHSEIAGIFLTAFRKLEGLGNNVKETLRGN